MIRITRVSASKDILRAYKIFIDGRYRGRIWRNQIKEFEVGKGKHTVRAKIDWGGSNELCIDVNDSVVDIEVGNSVVGLENVFWLSYLTVSRNEYLFLREKEPLE